MDYIIKKETQNFIVELVFNLKTRKTTCKTFDKSNDSLIFNQTFKCSAHKFIEAFFKENRLSKFLQQDVDCNKKFISSRYFITPNTHKLKVECFLKNKNTETIVDRREYTVLFNDLLDDVDADINESWFQELCSTEKQE